MPDRSHGYEAIADDFARIRDRRIGLAEVGAWARTLGRGAAVLDVACGTGEPVTRALVEAGCQVFAIDASPRMVAIFAAAFPDVPVRCEAVEQSSFFDRRFDGVIAWGVMFLLAEAAQLDAIARLAAAVAPGGTFVFTAPAEPLSWKDAMTDLPSVSLGADRYRAALAAAGLRVVREFEDEGDNHYYVAARAD